MNFQDVKATSKDEEIRAWSLEKAIEYAERRTVMNLVEFASKIEEYVKSGS